jgi:hypothetical protein
LVTKFTIIMSGDSPEEAHVRFDPHTGRIYLGVSYMEGYLHPTDAIKMGRTLQVLGEMRKL